jgi:hypothetical protein
VALSLISEKEEAIDSNSFLTRSKRSVAANLEVSLSK